MWFVRRVTRPWAGCVRFGSLRRLSPISSVWGLDRGRPLDRYYIENFLESHRTDVRGRVLEAGNNAYTVRFGDDRVVRRRRYGASIAQCRRIR